MQWIGSTLCFSRRPLEEALQLLADLGFPAIDLGAHQDWAHIFPAELIGRESETAERVAALLERFSLQAAALNVGLRASAAGERHQRWRAVCRFASLLGVPVVTLAAPARHTPRDEAVEWLTDVVEIARRHEVVPTIETHVHCLTEEPEVARELCEAVEGLYLTFDPSHFIADPERGRGYEILYPYARHVHLRDATVGKIQVPLSQGEVPFETILAQLREAGYQAACSIEFVDTLSEGDPLTEVARLRDYLKGLQGDE